MQLYIILSIRLRLASFKDKHLYIIDEISMHLTKLVITSFAKPLVCHHYFEWGVFQIRVIHFYKTVQYLSNYRLVSILLQVSIFIGNAFSRRLTTFLTLCKWLHNSQYEFKENHLTYLIEVMRGAFTYWMESKRLTCGIFEEGIWHNWPFYVTIKIIHFGNSGENIIL